MIGYYWYDCDWDEKLLAPWNFFVTGNENGEIVGSPDLNPLRISKPHLILKQNKKSLEAGLIAILDIPNGFLKELRGYCFSGRIDRANVKVKEIFLYVQKNWRKINIEDD